MPPLLTPSLLSRAIAPCRSFTLISTGLWLRSPRTARQSVPAASTRPMHSTPVLCKKKGGKQDHKQAVERDSDTSATKESANPEDFTQLQDEIAKAQTLMKDTIGKLRTGGKFNHELLEGLRVELGKDSKQLVKLGDLAQVFPRSGRHVVVLVNEQDHVKAVNSTIQSSPYSLNPSINPQNPLELQIAIPPPTAESRKQIWAEAEKAGEKTYHTIRQSRGAHQKKLNKMEKAKLVRPDDLHKARQNMEKLIEEANAFTKGLLDRAKKALES